MFADSVEDAKHKVLRYVRVAVEEAEHRIGGRPYRDTWNALVVAVKNLRFSEEVAAQDAHLRYIVSGEIAKVLGELPKGTRKRARA